MEKKRILIGCARSGVLASAFEEMGWEATECDIEPGTHHRHIKGDIRDILNHGWDMLIAHPPCTRLCNSGVRWLHERNLWDELRDAISLFRRCLEAPIKLKCIENPIPHKYAIDGIGRKYDQLIQPYMFGHGETKATCLWLDDLPKLIPTNIVSGRQNRIHKMPPSKDRGWLRSITYPGIAKAMAEQWTATGGLLPSIEENLINVNQNSPVGRTVD